MSKQGKPRQKHTRPIKDPRFFDPDIYMDWLTGKPKKAAYVPKGRRAPEAINIIR